MPLTWDLTKIENHKEVCWIKNEDEATSEGHPGTYRLSTVTETLIFATMAVKLGSITEANADDFYARLKIIEKLDGPFMFKIEDGERKDMLFTPEMVQAHIGLVCNVSNESFAKFLGTVRADYKALKHQYKAALRQKEKVTT